MRENCCAYCRSIRKEGTRRTLDNDCPVYDYSSNTVVFESDKLLHSVTSDTCYGINRVNFNHSRSDAAVKSHPSQRHAQFLERVHSIAAKEETIVQSSKFVGAFVIYNLNLCTPENMRDCPRARIAIYVYGCQGTVCCCISCTKGIRDLESVDDHSRLGDVISICDR